MKVIPLSQGQAALVDDEDYEKLARFNWRVLFTKSGPYAQGRIETSDGYMAEAYMHRVIMGAKKGELVDHRNHNGLDNRRANLRLCTKSQNMQNQRKKKPGSSRYKGVAYFPKVGGWKVRVTVPNPNGGRGTERHIGLFYDEREAARAYNRAAAETYGDFAVLNEVEND